MADHSTSTKPGLTRERILAEAVAFADESDLDALTMRKLADRLGVGTMSLYNHVANKDDMIEGMVDVIVGEIAHPTSGDWRDGLQDSAASAHRVLLSHPWAAGEWTRRRPGPARTGYMEAILRTLVEAELDEVLVYHGYHAVTMHIVGFTIQELGYLAAGPDLAVEGITDDFLDGLRQAGLPHLADHALAHIDGTHRGDEFRFVLDLILDGLEQSSSTSENGI